MDRFVSYLNDLYGEQTTTVVCLRIMNLLETYRPRIPKPKRTGIDHQDSILIAYADQVRDERATPLATLAGFCNRYLKRLISTVHLLPFYPWSSDDGFAVIDYHQVDPFYGDWDDVHRLGHTFRLMYDLVLNHVSAQSEWFQGFLRGEPHYRDYFIVVEGNPDLSQVVRPRVSPLLTRFPTAMGEKKVWTTFSADQVDLNYGNPDVLLKMLELFLFYLSQGAEFIRLDAVAYLWKQIGTPCIHLPQTHALVRLFRAVLEEVAPHAMLIAETNVPHEENLSYLGDGKNEAHLVYNFALPPLVLHTFQTGSCEALTYWAKELALPSRQVSFLNFLASHDGIGLNPVRGILSDTEIEAMIHRTQACSGLVSAKSNPDGRPSPYELNINYFDALSDPTGTEPLAVQVKRFVVAHAIMLSLAGVPGIYFHSLFGSRGWPEGVHLSGRNRAINRQKLRRADLEAELSDPYSLRSQVFYRLARLFTIRRAHSAFHPFGAQRVLECSPQVFGMVRLSPDGMERVLCFHNVSAEPQRLSVPAEAVTGIAPSIWLDLISGETYRLAKGSSLHLSPYQVAWLSLLSTG